MELGYALGKDHWRQGYAQEALACFLDHCFEALAVRRIEARVDSRNAASSGLLRRLGFVSEGCLREWMMEGTTPIDSQLFALLAHERAGATR
ncbi:N-acetyltransferase [Seongchinamella unica]|uniref:N-acetyltransferase n=1 Tax=Seongchinamella unica TaxID=2547392 RepID=A0A4R5LTK1_9GAMM|nr:N-acetyltransferase [Seongchinamella unica]